MATHQLYTGGPAGTNISRAQYPRPVFVASDWADVGVSAHKPSGVVVLNRTIDVADYALANYLKANPPVATDVLNIDIVPGGSLLLGAHLWIETAAADATVALSIGGVAFGTAVSAVGKRFAVPAGAAWITTQAAATLASTLYIPTAVPVALTLGQAAALNLKGLRLHVSVLVAECIPNNRSQANV